MGFPRETPLAHNDMCKGIPALCHQNSELPIHPAEHLEPID